MVRLERRANRRVLERLRAEHGVESPGLEPGGLLGKSLMLINTAGPEREFAADQRSVDVERCAPATQVVQPDFPYAARAIQIGRGCDHVDRPRTLAQAEDIGVRAAADLNRVDIDRI